eukprot:Skav210243  [mRNA]  locus=scaffold1929:78098:84749:+ [translate_table: standard]
MRPAFSVIGLAVVVLATVLITLRTLHSLSFGFDRKVASSTHVVLCNDNSELRPLFLTIKTTLQHARDPSSLQFHVITSPQLEKIYSEMLGTFLPDVKMQVHTNPSMLHKIRKFLTYRSSSEAEQEMANVFRFVPFFLPEFLGRISYGDSPPRLIYFDTDNIVLGDVAELANLRLRGHPLAATRYCGTELQEFVDFSLIKRFQDVGPVREKDCPISRAVMVIDPVKWQFLNISGKFLNWLVRYRDQPLREDLWWHHLDIPPLMLSLYGFLELRREWSCVNLGMKDPHSLDESGDGARLLT